MSEPPPASDRGPEQPSQWLVRCSRDRVLIARRDPSDQRMALLKIYESGTLEEAQREVQLAGSLATAHIVRYRQALIDPATSRPCVVMDYVQGVNLEEWLAQRGPLSPRSAAHVGRLLARALDELHSSSGRVAAHGVVHCDVKPGNAMLTGETPDPLTSTLVLVDLEHAVPRAATAIEAVVDRGFTGGTHGYAPPEAYDGALPTPAFDVFGLGATLQALLTGSEAFPGHDPAQIAAAVQAGRRAQALLPVLPATLQMLIADCLRHDPGRRPSMREVIARLDDFLAARDDAEVICDRAMHAAWSGDLDAADQALAAAGAAGGDRVAALRRTLDRRRRLLARVGTVDVPALTATGLAARTESLVTAATRVAGWLERFPCDARVLRLRRSITRDVDRLLYEVPPAIRQQVRAAQFDDAERLITTAVRAATVVASFPGRVPIIDTPSSAMPGPLQRDPLRFLRLTLEEVRIAAKTHAGLREKLRATEANLELDAAQRILDDAAGLYSGANEVVAGLKDRLHRFGFYLEQLAQADQELSALREQAEVLGLDIDLEPLEAFAALCRERTRSTPAKRAAGNVRHLQHTLRDLLEEFPHVQPAAAAAVDCLARATDSFTEGCWDTLAEARRLLTAEPIPIRPLQSLLNRIDRIRLLEVLVDQEKRSRAQLMDELERVRLKVERARATRDRLARGAQAAMDRGHLTTALYDMERAVGQFASGSGEAEPEREHLIEQLQLVREKKGAVEASAVANRRLAQRYAELRDDPDSDFEERLRVLEERRQSLQLLIDSLQEERAAAYREDLRELRISVLQERAEHSERQLDRTDDLDERVRIARATLQEIAIAAELQQPTREPIGRVQRILAHWQNHLERGEIALQRREAEDARRAHQRRNRLTLLAVLVGVLLLAGFLLGRCAG